MPGFVSNSRFWTFHSSTKTPPRSPKMSRLSAYGQRQACEGEEKDEEDSRPAAAVLRHYPHTTAVSDSIQSPTCWPTP
jgi:hypothetical protein